MVARLSFYAYQYPVPACRYMLAWLLPAHSARTGRQFGRLQACMQMNVSLLFVAVTSHNKTFLSCLHSLLSVQGRASILAHSHHHQQAAAP